MPQIMGIDPNSILRILTNTDDPSRNLPGPQTADQIKNKDDYAYGLMKNMQLQGNAYYTPMNAFADSLRGYMGGRYLEKGERATRNRNESDANALTRGIFPNYGGQTQPTLRQPVQSEGMDTGPSVKSRVTPIIDAGANIDALVKEAAEKAGVDPSWLRTFVDIESGGNPKAKSGKYVGLLQLSPEEAAKYGGQGANLSDPAVNLTLGAMKLKSDSEAFKQKYGRDPSPEEIYMVHQQGEGGFDAHMNNPDAPAWQNMSNTAEGRSRGSNWAKSAIWKNVPDDAKKQFGSVDNITSGQFMQMWGDRVKQRMTRYGQPNTDLATKPMNFGQEQTMAPSNQFSDPARKPGRASLQFNAEQTLNPQNMFAGGSPMLDTPAGQVGQQISQAGGTTPNGDFLPGPGPEPTIDALGAPGQSEIPKNVMPQPPANQTIMPKTTPGIPSPPEGTIPINAEVPNTQDQFAGMSQTRQPEMIPTSDTVADGDFQDNSGQGLVDLPTSPYSQMNPNQLYDILKSPTIDQQTKLQFMQKAQEQGQMQSIPVEGGKLYFNPRTGKQLYVPEPKWDKTSIGGISVPTISIKKKLTGPWESFLMDGTPVGGSKTSTQQGQGGQEGVIPAQSEGAASQQTRQSGGIEGLAARGRDIKSQDITSEKLATDVAKERGDYITEGRSADTAKIGLKKLRELENAPENADITTGSWAPAWNEFKKNWNAWAPKGAAFKEGPMSLSDVYQSMATIVGATLARTTDPNPSVRQFEALVGSNPSITQTPAGRKALLAALIHDVEMRGEMGQVARNQSLNQKQYDAKIQGIREKYKNMQIIPEKLLETLRGKDARTLKKAKWLSGPEDWDKVKIGDQFFTPEGELRTRTK